ncbi:MAG: carboxymuconolactone decarboxylase family protein, partial [Bacteroidota bacterium]|nr:carboxymuconolactone decarboxylase family protein [Bacteroidota bacterium]
MPENPLKTILEIDSNFLDQLKKMEVESIYNDGALPKKFKYLMAMAFDAQHGAVGGVKALAIQAMKAGATNEVIVEALHLAFY